MTIGFSPLRCSLQVLSFLLCLSFSHIIQAHHPIKVAYTKPDKWAFWQAYGDFLEEVAKDLGVQLTSIDVHSSNVFEIHKTIKSNIADKKDQDYLITSYFPHVGLKTIKLLNEAQVPFFITNTDIPEKEKSKVGTPREKFPQWIGHMFPDDRKAGYDLADILLNNVEKKNKQMIALRGWYKNSAATERELGLKQRVASGANSRLLRLIGTSRGEKQARDSSERLLMLYPELSAIWASADNLALGAIQAAKNLGLEPGIDVHIGGIDWTSEAIEAIKNGEMDISIGGHFMEGGWALIMLYDYAHGIDFKKDERTTIKSEMHAITKNNVEQYAKYFSTQKWKDINFKHFSKVHNKNLTDYDFSLARIFSLLQQEETKNH